MAKENTGPRESGALPQRKVKAKTDVIAVIKKLSKVKVKVFVKFIEEESPICSLHPASQGSLKLFQDSLGLFQD